MGAKRAGDFAVQANFPGERTLGSCFLAVFDFEIREKLIGTG